MDLAIVTGANALIGYTIAEKLVELGFRVYGLDHHFKQCHFAHRDFIRVECDIASWEVYANLVDQIEAASGNLFLVVNAAAYCDGEPFETTDPEVLAYRFNTELLGPVMLTRLVLPSLIKYHGYVVNVCWEPGSDTPANAAGTAFRKGLVAFGRELFAELQDTGVKVCNLSLQSDSELKAHKNKQSSIDPERVAEALEQVLQFKENNCIHELTIRPMGTRETPKIPTAVVELVRGPRDIELPSRDKFAAEPELILTPVAKVPEDAVYFEDEDSEEDEDDELDKLLEASRQSLLQQKERAESRNQSGEQRRNRNRRRGGRNRRRRKRPEDEPDIPSPASDADAEAKTAKSQAEGQRAAHRPRSAPREGGNPGSSKAPKRAADAPSAQTTPQAEVSPQSRNPAQKKHPVKKRATKKKVAKKKTAKKKAAVSSPEPVNAAS